MQIATKNLILTIGYTAGPFMATLIFIFIHFFSGWQKNSILGTLALPISVGFGLICFGLRHPPNRWSWLLAIPYVFVFTFAVLAFAIIPLIMLGAPK